MNATPDTRYMEQLADTSFRPVFILGFPRSGTTILYRVLDKTGQFNVVTLYHVLYHDRLLSHFFNGGKQAAVDEISAYFERHGVDTREADSLSVGPCQPTEYGFMLPERGFPWNVTEKNSGRLSLLCKKIAFMAGNEQPVLLKNPFDFGNFVRVKRLFPNARFVFIHRHPVDVLDSQMRGMRQIFRQKNDYLALIFGKYDEGYDNPLLRQFFRQVFSPYIPLGLFYLLQRNARAGRYYVDNIDWLPAEDYVAVTYEELCRHPTETVSRILGHFDLDASFDAERYIQPRDTDTAPRVRTLNGFICRRMRRYCRRLGYTLPG
ncbi:MAG: sulfotransferase [Thermoplasmatota archaeon]